MRFLQLTLAAFLTAGLSATAAPEEKQTDVKKLLVGKWEVAKADPDTISVGTVVEFTADGKMKVSEKQDGKVVLLEGSYTIDGNAFKMALKVGEQEFKQKIAIKKLTETELDTADEQGKNVTLKRVK